MPDVKIEERKIQDMTFHHNRWVTTRVRNVLGRNGIHTLEQLLGLTETDLLGMDNIGPISLANIKAKLDGMGLSLREEGW